MTTQEKLEDAETALHIAQVDRDKWKTRAIKLAKFLGIRDCDIDDFDLNNATNGDVIKALFPNCVMCEDFGSAVITNLNGEEQYWRSEWWNSPYKKEGDGE